MRIKLFLASVLSGVLPFAAHADVTLHLNHGIELLALMAKNINQKCSIMTIT